MQGVWQHGCSQRPCLDEPLQAWPAHSTLVTADVQGRPAWLPTSLQDEIWDFIPPGTRILVHDARANAPWSARRSLLNLGTRLGGCRHIVPALILQQGCRWPGKPEGSKVDAQATLQGRFQTQHIELVGDEPGRLCALADTSFISGSIGILSSLGHEGLEPPLPKGDLLGRQLCLSAPWPSLGPIWQHLGNAKYMLGLAVSQLHGTTSSMLNITL